MKVARFIVIAERLKNFKKEEILGCDFAPIVGDVIIWKEFKELKELEEITFKCYCDDQEVLHESKGGMLITEVFAGYKFPDQYDNIIAEYAL